MYLNFLICEIRLMITMVPASGASRGDAVTEHSKGTFDKNTDDSPSWEEVEKAATKRTRVLLAPSSIFMIGCGTY